MSLSKKQFDILEAYATNSHLTQRGLAEITNQSVGNVNRLVKELADTGLVEDGKITADGLAALEPYRVKRAVILAAGVGSRLMPVTLNTPKPLVRVKGKRIIDGLIDEVLALGIQEIYIVRGYLSEQFDQIQSLYPMVQFLENPIYNESNNISSAMCARYLLSNAYVFEADLIIRSGLIKRYHYTSDFLATYQERCDDWCFKAKDGIITEEKLGYIDVHNVRSSYSEGKRIGELLCSSYHSQFGVPVKMARLAQTFGAGVPSTDGRVFAQFARSLINGEDIVLHTKGGSVGNYCYTADVVEGILTLLTKGESGQSYNIVNENTSMMIREVASLVADDLGEGKIKVIFDIPTDNKYGYPPETKMRLSGQKMRDLGWTPGYDLPDMFRRLIAYWEE